MICTRCECQITPMTARTFEVAGKPKETLCESCHVTATVQAGAKVNAQHIGRIFEYRLVRLANERDGAEAVERELNRLAAGGWRIVPVVACGGFFGVMERESARV